MSKREQAKRRSSANECPADASRQANPDIATKMIKHRLIRWFLLKFCDKIRLKICCQEIKMNNITYPNEDIQKELDKLKWMSKPEFENVYYQAPNWAKNPPYYLFRTYGFPSDEVQTDGLVHGSAVVLWNKFSRVKLSQTIKNFPNMPSCLVKVYAGSKDNVFYQDETLEDVFYGYSQHPGESAQNVKQFNEKDHFETNVVNNKLLKIFILKFDKEYQFAEIDQKSKLFEILKNNEIPHKPKLKNQHSYRNAEKEKSDKEWLEYVKKVNSENHM
jgi:hypothetical protein